MNGVKWANYMHWVEWVECLCVGKFVDWAESPECLCVGKFVDLAECLCVGKFVDWVECLCVGKFVDWAECLCVSLVYRFRGWAKSFPLLSGVCPPAQDDSSQKRAAIR